MHLPGTVVRKHADPSRLNVKEVRDPPLLLQSWKHRRRTGKAVVAQFDLVRGPHGQRGVDVPVEGVAAEVVVGEPGVPAVSRSSRSGGGHGPGCGRAVNQWVCFGREARQPYPSPGVLEGLPGDGYPEVKRRGGGKAKRYGTTTIPPGPERTSRLPRLAAEDIGQFTARPTLVDLDGMGAETRMGPLRCQDHRCVPGAACPPPGPR